MPCGVVTILQTEKCHLCQEEIAVNDDAFYGTLRSKGSPLRFVSFLSLELDSSKYHSIGASATKRGAGKDDIRWYRHTSCHFKHVDLSKTIWTFEGFRTLKKETQLKLYDELKTNMRNHNLPLPKLPKEWHFLDPSMVRKPKRPRKRRCVGLVAF